MKNKNNRSKFLTLLILLFFNSQLWAYCKPGFENFYFNAGSNFTVKYCEEVRIPLYLRANRCGLKHHQTWSISANSRLEIVSGYCPSTASGDVGLGGYASCQMNVVVKSTSMNNVQTGFVSYHWWGESKNKNHSWKPTLTVYYTVKTIPHPISI